MKKISKRNVGGFTLIELLVVVLIIGILSAVALPQYQKTVLKSRTAEAWANLSALHKAAEVYCLENPTTSYTFYSDLKSVLSIQVDDSNNFSYGGSIDCTTYPKIGFAAIYNKGGKSFKLGLGPQGERLCTGDCRDLGFTEADNLSVCHCGVSDNGYCYYLN